MPTRISTNGTRPTHDLNKEWETDPRWSGLVRDYTAKDVELLRGTVPIEHSLARRGSQKLWQLLNTEPYVAALGCLTGQQAVQMAKAGLKALYLSGWQVAADNNLAGQTYPDQSLYPSNSVPTLVRRLNNALLRTDQIYHSEGRKDVEDWMLPIIADAEAGFGGALHAYELTRNLIEAGAAAVHFEDQLASEKKCGHMGGRVLVPTQQHIRTLRAARLASDVAGVPTVLIARTDAATSKLLTSDIDPRDRPFVHGQRTPDGYYHVQGGLEIAIARGLAYAPYADLLWFETNMPNLDEAKRFANAIHAKYPGKLLAYNCSSSFNWKRDLDNDTIAGFQKELGRLGYKFQFITLAGFHVLSQATFELARDYRRDGLPAYVRLQQREFELEPEGYTATRHQREVGAAYFDEIAKILSGEASGTLALAGSTEKSQFNGHKLPEVHPQRRRRAPKPTVKRPLVRP